ncbi:MAG: CBS domain-containing protein [Gammaproteobacteria bacterium]|nr:CBS domain-containing protein [Gammaproteobacteria bacterium]
MNIRQIMTRRIVTIGMDDPLSLARDIFHHTRFHHLLVVENGKLFGVLSDRDLLKSVSPYVGTASETARDVASLNKRVHQVMSRKPICLPLDGTIREAVAIFNENVVSCIPVVDDSKHPVGIVSWRDLLKILTSKYCDLD